MACAKRVRSDLTHGEKRSVCIYAQSNLKSTKQQIADHFSAYFNKRIARTTIGDILRERDRWIAIPEHAGDVKRDRAAKFGNLEQCLFQWFAQASSQNVPLSDDILTEKAKQFGAQLAISAEEFSYSSGWLSNFKKRFGIARYKLTGESNAVDLLSVNTGRVELQKVLAAYSPEDIANLDETGVFYRLPPNSTLATKPIHGTKKIKDRLTVVLCSNATGSFKMKPIVIGKAARPRCFGKTFNPNNLVTYKSNANAWMITREFHELVKELDAQMRSRNRKIILLVDNCSSHSTPEGNLTNVRLHFLPPNTTAHLQPLDAGIIQTFKIHYRKLLVRHYVQCVDTKQDMTIDVKQALYFIRDAWNTVSESTIAGCWNRVGILPPALGAEITAEREPHRRADDLEELNELLQALAIPPDQLMDANTYLAVDTAIPTIEPMTDDDIINSVTGAESSTTNEGMISGPDSDIDDIPPRTISHSEAVSALQTVTQYFEQLPSTTSEHLDQLSTLMKDLLISKGETTKQARITDFFSST
ncbi:MAG: Uncharacterized protein FD143_3102 [Ignavibacteria bacterium]|nr:MAG: Uncharacterized protein FD143_3102 [Ignavibacteria bacterium]